MQPHEELNAYQARTRRGELFTALNQAANRRRYVAHAKQRDDAALASAMHGAFLERLEYARAQRACAAVYGSRLP